LDYHTEVKTSTDWINENLGVYGKKVKVLQWSGNCRPPKPALVEAKKANLLNINGGDSRFDLKFNSFTNVAPLYKTVNSHIQIYSTNANENLYTNLWEGPFSGFVDVIQTFRKTEKPFRFRPINIYYHFYSAAKVASLLALKKVYEWTSTQKVAPVYTSEYLKIVDGFINTRIEQRDDNHFIISNYQALRTFRMLDEHRYPDLEKSRNIIGWEHFQGNLYLYLGSEKKTVLRLSDKKSRLPYVVSSNSKINNFSRLKSFVNLELSQNLKSSTIIGNMRKNRKYKLKIELLHAPRSIQKTSANIQIREMEVKSNEKGEINIIIPGIGKYRVEIRT